jgi:hypothetical protein
MTESFGGVENIVTCTEFLADQFYDLTASEGKSALRLHSDNHNTFLVHNGRPGTTRPDAQLCSTADEVVKTIAAANENREIGHSESSKSSRGHG